MAQNDFHVVLVAPHAEDEIVDGVQIRSVPLSHTRLDRMFLTGLRVLRKAFEEAGDLYHFHDPELIPIGLILRIFGKKVIQDVHEDLPRQILRKAWIPARLRQTVSVMAECVEWLAARAFSGIVCVTPAILKRFPLHKSVLIQNLPILTEFSVVGSLPYRERPGSVVYVGGVEKIRGIHEMLLAVKKLPGELSARLLIAGTCNDPSPYLEAAGLKEEDEIRFLGWQSRDQVMQLLGQARVGLVLYHPVPDSLESQPNKLFEYMAAGIPLVASDRPLWREIVGDAGLLVDPLDPAAIARAIQWVLENPVDAEAMGKRGIKRVKERFAWEGEGEKLLQFYREILS